MNRLQSQAPDRGQDVLVRDLGLAWPSGAIGPHWTVWCCGKQLFASVSRDTAITRARVEAASLVVAVWLESSGGNLEPL